MMRRPESRRKKWSTPPFPGCIGSHGTMVYLPTLNPIKINQYTSPMDGMDRNDPLDGGDFNSPKFT